MIPGRRISSLDPGRSVAVLDDGTELPFDLFLGVPKHRAPEVVIASGMTEDGYVPVDSATLRTRFPGVYAVGDVATAGVPKAGVFAEGAARVVAQQLIAELRDGERARPLRGRGSCYIEFGSGRVGRVDIDFLSGPTGPGPSTRRPRPWSPRRSTSAPAAARAGSAPETQTARRLVEQRAARAVDRARALELPEAPTEDDLPRIEPDRCRRRRTGGEHAVEDPPARQPRDAGHLDLVGGERVAGESARSTPRTFRPRRARSMAVEAPATRVPTTMTS